MNAYTLLMRFACLLVVLAGGCSKEKMDELVSQAKDTATSVASDVTQEVTKEVESITEAAGDVSGVGDTTGKATMMLDAPTEFAASYIQFVTIEGRPSVLKIKSNKDGETDVFPAFLLQSQVTAPSLDALNGQRIAARLFAQKQADGPIWYSPDDKPVQVVIQIVEGKVTAKLDAASVLESANEQPVTVSGTFDCAAL